ncbi:MAG: glycosyltransferase family 2 protein [Planctomycetota bacterium]|jgi:glycosyltransferase involved in cell wall biosynthesis
MAHATISVTIITKNESHNLRACLEAVSWADEIVVVDSGSTDGTPEIAREFTDRVYVEPYQGQGPQKNLALDRATCDWVLSLDADERVPPGLAAAIRDAVAANEKDGYWICRRSSYCGRYMRFGDWSRDWVLRLFRRGRGRFTDDSAHERVVVNGTTGRLGPRLLHHSIRSHRDLLEKINLYSDLWAQQAHARGRRCSFAAALAHGAWSFLRCGVLLGGFLDGSRGVTLAIAAAEGSFYRYLKLHELSRGGRGKRDAGGPDGADGGGSFCADD